MRMELQVGFEMFAQWFTNDLYYYGKGEQVFLA